MTGRILIPERIPITMNRRRFFQFCLAGTVSPCLLALQPASLFAQGAPRAAQTRQSTARSRRPVGQPLRGKPPTPEVRKILQDWEYASGKFKKLQGEHHRWIYDFVFNLEKRTKGSFWFESPDKGRMDIEPWTSTAKPRVLGKNGKKLPGGKPFKVQPGKEEQWVSNGKEISVVNVAEKTIEVFPIPKDIQGQGITESPLPFLFGMKAKKAEVRYDLSAGPHNNPARGRIHLIAFPRLAKDARNWSRAEVMLDAKTFYPQAIKLIDPSGNSETVYQFSGVRQPGFFAKQFGGDPFVIKRNGFKRIVHQPPKAQGVAANGQPKMPRLIGQPWKTTKAMLEKAGYEVKLRQGLPAPQQKDVFRIYRQSPQPGTPLKKGMSIVLTLYNKSSRTSAKPTGTRRK